MDIRWISGAFLKIRTRSVLRRVFYQNLVKKFCVILLIPSVNAVLMEKKKSS